MMSVLLADEYFCSRVLSRQSNVGCSSHFYYSGCSEGVPFHWEKQPGKPINPPEKDEVLPPISPPPAMLSSRFPKPSFTEEPKTAWSSSPWLFWKKMIKGKSGINRAPTEKRSAKSDQRVGKSPSCRMPGSDRGSEVWSSASSSLSSSSSGSPFGAPPSHPSAYHCRSPKKIRKFMLCFSR